LASFLDTLHANSANHTVPRHTAPPILKNARKQKILHSLLQKAEIPETAEVLHTIEFSGMHFVFAHASVCE
jgi:hypothetical protein